MVPVNDVTGMPALPVSIDYIAAAILAAAVPRFEATSFNGFTKNYQ